MTKYSDCVMVFKAADGIAESLRQIGIQVHYDGDYACYEGGRSGDRWFIYSMDVELDERMHAMDRHAPFVSALIDAHAKLMPAYAKANAICDTLWQREKDNARVVGIVELSESRLVDRLIAAE